MTKLKSYLESLIEYCEEGLSSARLTPLFWLTLVERSLDLILQEVKLSDDQKNKLHQLLGRCQQEVYEKFSNEQRLEALKNFKESLG